MPWRFCVITCVRQGLFIYLPRHGRDSLLPKRDWILGRQRELRANHDEICDVELHVGYWRRTTMQVHPECRVAASAAAMQISSGYTSMRHFFLSTLLRLFTPNTF